MPNNIENGYQDITNEVKAFLGYDLKPGEEQSVAIPDLRVVALHGLLKVSRHIQDFDGCHPYEYDERSEADGFTVRQISIGKSQYGGRGWKEIETDKGPLSVDDEELQRYAFYKPAQEKSRKISKNEARLTEFLKTVPFLVEATSDQLVGYEYEIFASAAEPLKYPISVPKRSRFGHAAPLRNTPIGAVSACVDQSGNKQVTLITCEYGSSVQLDSVPLDKITFEVREREDKQNVLLDRALELAALSFGEVSPKLQEVIDAYNALGAQEKLMYIDTRREYDSWQEKTSGMIAKLDGDQIVSVAPAQKDDLSVSLRPDKIIIEPYTKQLYVADMQAGKALSAQHVRIGTPDHVNDVARFRR